MNKIETIYRQDKLFPEKLKSIKTTPKKLYAIGNLKLLETDCIAIVGCRKCSEYGIRMAKKFSKELVDNGITLVSGLALRNR